MNLWYLDDGNLGDDYRTVSKDLKKNVEAETNARLKHEPRNANFFLSGITEKRRSRILATFQNFCPGTHQRKINLSLLVHRSPDITSRLIGKEIY